MTWRIWETCMFFVRDYMSPRIGSEINVQKSFWKNGVSVGGNLKYAEEKCMNIGKKRAIKYRMRSDCSTPPSRAHWSEILVVRGLAARLIDIKGAGRVINHNGKAIKQENDNIKTLVTLIGEDGPYVLIDFLRRCFRHLTTDEWTFLDVPL